MGSFCISCCASRQTIADDDACVVIPIHQASTFTAAEMTLAEQHYSLFGVSNNTCHPESFWEPIGGFITGHYADYGRIAPEDTRANRRNMGEFFNMLLKGAPVVSPGENRSHDVPFDIKSFMAENTPALAERLFNLKWLQHAQMDDVPFEEMNKLWDYVWNVAEENRLFCRNYNGKLRPLQFAALHQASVDNLVTHVSRLKCWSGHSYELSENLTAHLARYRETLEQQQFETDADRKGWQSFHRMDVLRGLTLGHERVVPFLYDYLALLDKHLDQGSDFAELVEALRPVLAGAYVFEGMEALNLKFSPIEYGGQDYDNTEGRAYARFVRSVSAQVTLQRKALYA